MNTKRPLRSVWSRARQARAGHLVQDQAAWAQLQARYGALHADPRHQWSAAETLELGLLGGCTVKCVTGYLQ